MSAKGDDLERIADLEDFEMFRPELERAVPRSNGAKGGRPAFDHVVMFKVLLLQAMHTLSDERREYLIRDRLSFMSFLGMGLADPVPDANTIWNYREALKRAGAVDRLFQRFDTTLRSAGYLAMSGQIVDATIVAAPRQRNTTAEKDAIKGGAHPAGLAEKPAKLRQKDRDARWTDRPGAREDRPRQSGVQHEAPCLAQWSSDAGVISNGTAMAQSHVEPIDGPLIAGRRATGQSDNASAITVPNIAVVGGVHLCLGVPLEIQPIRTATLYISDHFPLDKSKLAYVGLHHPPGIPSFRRLRAHFESHQQRAIRRSGMTLEAA